LIEALKGKVAACLFDCGTAPENYIIPILNSNPDTVILLDAADFGRAPGDIDVFEMSEVLSVGFSTHNSSPRLLADLFKIGKSDLNIFMVVTQPKNISFGENLSDEIKRSIEYLKDIFTKILAAARR
jgi:hydrogenase 3 maturation protease